MSDIYVRTDSLNQASAQLTDISGKIEKIAEDAGNIVRATRSTISSRLVESGKAALIYASVSNCAADMRNLSSQLRGVSEIYEAFEKRIVDLYNVSEKEVQNEKFIVFKKDHFVNLNAFDLTYCFLDGRNQTKDGILFGMSRGLSDGVKSLINKGTGGDDFNDEIFKDTILRVLNSVAGKETDLSLGKDIADIVDTYGGNSVSAANALMEMMNKKGLGEVIGGIKGKTLDNIGDIMTMGEGGIELLELYLNDYTKTISVLQDMKKGLDQVNGSGETIDHINQLIESYNNKFATTIQTVKGVAVNIGVDKVLEATAGAATGGLFNLADAAHGIIWNATGVTKKGDCLGSVYASIHYSDDLVNAYDYYAQKLQTGNYTESDAQMCKTMFELARQAKIDEYTYVKSLVGKEDKTILNQEIDKLQTLNWNSASV